MDALKIVLYLFRMADDRITSTGCFARLSINAEIKCTRCEHKAIVTPPEFGRMFPKPLPLTWVRYRLKCKACGARAPLVKPLYRNVWD